ncbi:MAG: twin-arginine translocation signal domain-containing protein, partial [Lacipirellulaceae bacterium]
MDRRNFLGTLTTTGAGLAASTHLLLSQTASFAESTKLSQFDKLTKSLLVDWCDGMIAHQIVDPGNPAFHGGLACPACPRIHGRCSDALYPFLHLANVTGDQKYLTAAINVYDWAENN